MATRRYYRSRRSSKKKKCLSVPWPLKTKPDTNFVPDFDKALDDTAARIIAAFNSVPIFSRQISYDGPCFKFSDRDPLYVRYCGTDGWIYATEPTAKRKPRRTLVCSNEFISAVKAFGEALSKSIRLYPHNITWDGVNLNISTPTRCVIISMLDGRWCVDRTSDKDDWRSLFAR